MTRIPARSGPQAHERPQLETRDLELVLALARAGTTARAAAHLHVTQSAISRALANTEDRLGAPLFDRGARGLTPTAAGARLIAGAPAVLEHLRALEREVVAPEAPLTRLRLVSECYTAYRWVPSAMAHLRRWDPGLVVDVVVEHTHDPVAALVRGDIDIALLTTATLPRATNDAVPLLERPLLADEVVFIVAADHPLARAKVLDVAHLSAYPIITSTAPPEEARWFAKSVFGRRRPKLEFIRLPLTEGIMDAARAGMGIAVVSEWMASGYVGVGGLVVKRLAAGPLRRPWRIAYHRGCAAAAQQLREVLASARPDPIDPLAPRRSADR